MRAIPKPTYAPNAVFDLCVNNTTDPLLRAKLTDIAPEMLAALTYYDRHANEGTLHTVPQSTHQGTDLLLGQVTKDELRKLYDNQMLPRRKAAREIYDALRAAAPGGKCPTCGFGHVQTIDHFLPKSGFPWFSVLPENLVPACRDCNTGKMANAANDAQCFHPYYDVAPLMDEQWIFAEILQTNPIGTRFFVRAPEHWDELTILRATNHFREYKLGLRFGIEAASELSALIPQFSLPPMQSHEVLDALDRRLRAERMNQCNSWKIALYEALRDCDWFCALRF